MISLKDIARVWNRFFFEPISPLPIAAYRICLGAVILCKQLLLLPDGVAWFGDRGTLSFRTARQVSGGTGFNLFDWLPHTDAMAWLVLVASCVVAIMVTIGFVTRVSSVLLFLLVVTLDHRNPLILNGGDTFLRIATFFLIFAPAGRALSVDEWLRKRRGDISGEETFAPWAMRMIQLQVAFLYLYAFVWKAMGAMWGSGTAVYYTSRLLEFWRFPLPYVFEHMWTIKLWSWATLGIELALGTLIWIKEFRYPVLLCGILLHLGIDYTMNIPLFAFIMIGTYVLFVEPEHLARFLGRFKRGAGRTGIAKRGPELPVEVRDA